MSDILVTVDNTPVIISVDDASVVVGVDQPEIVVATSGPPGPQGPQGPAGTVYPIRYTHNQAVMSPTWIVTHNLNCHPAVTAEDAVGNVIKGSITYIDNDMLTVGFAFSVTGRANCV